jgi:hypothetical protein
MAENIHARIKDEIRIRDHGDHGQVGRYWRAIRFPFASGALKPEKIQALDQRQRRHLGTNTQRTLWIRTKPETVSVEQLRTAQKPADAKRRQPQTRIATLQPGSSSTNGALGNAPGCHRSMLVQHGHVSERARSKRFWP